MSVFGNATDIRFNGNSATKAFLNNNQIWPTTSTLVTENLLLHYNTFNTASYNGSGATITDLSGNSRNGTVTGSPTWTGNYFTFVDDYITTPDLSSVIPISNKVHSVELWVYPTDNGVLVQYNGTTTPNESYHSSTIEIVGGNLEVGLWAGTELASTGNIGAVSFNEWHQIVLTYDGSICKGYLDGVFKGSVNVSFHSPMNDSFPFYMNFGYQDFTTQGDGTNFDGRFGIMRVYNIALTDAQVLSNYNSTVSTIINLTTNGLVLYYDPSSVSSYPGSGTTITDLSDNGRNGTMSNITYTSPYFTYNGVSSTISAVDNSVLEPESGDWTIEVWINHSVIVGSSRCIMSKTNGGNTADWGYGIRTTSIGNTYMEIGNGTTSITTPSHTLSINNWYQVVGVWTNISTNTMEFYVNGVSRGSNSHSFTGIKNTTRPLSLGSFDGGGTFGQWFNGKMGVVRLYNRALTSTEVLNNYNADKSKYGL